MDYQERLERMVMNGTIGADEAASFGQAMGQFTSAPSINATRKYLPVKMIALLTGSFLVGGIGLLLNTASAKSTETVQNVSEALNQSGATGNIGAGVTGITTISLLLLAPAGAILFLLAKSYNALVSADEETHRSNAVIQSCLQRRRDLVSGLLSAVQQAMTFEEGLQTSVTGQRNPKMEGLEHAVATDIDSGFIAPKLAAVMEAYPALRAHDNIMDLQRQLEAIERDLMIARNINAAAAADFNALVRGVLGSFVAERAGFNPAGYFKADTAAQKPLN